MKVALEMFVGFEAEALNDANDGGGIGVETLGKSANAEQDVLAGVLENWTNDFLTFDAELFDTLGKGNDRSPGRGNFGHGRHLYGTAEICRQQRQSVLARVTGITTCFVSRTARG